MQRLVREDCAQCGAPVMLAKISEPESGIDLYVFSCPGCRRLWTEGWAPDTTEVTLFSEWRRLTETAIPFGDEDVK